MSYTRYWALFNHRYISYYTFIHQTFTLYMSYTRYLAIFNQVIHSLYTFIHQTFTLHMSYTRYWSHIQPLIHSLYTFIHQTYTLHMSYTQYWAIFNHWYIAYTLLYIRHTPCTCRRRGIGPFSTGDTWPLYTFIHQTFTMHMSFTRYWTIFKNVIHSLYTFIHQTYTLHMSYTRYWAIFNHWYIAYTLLYMRHTPCTCSIRGIVVYSTIDT